MVRLGFFVSLVEGGGSVVFKRTFWKYLIFRIFWRGWFFLEDLEGLDASLSSFLV